MVRPPAHFKAFADRISLSPVWLKRELYLHVDHGRGKSTSHKLFFCGAPPAPAESRDQARTYLLNQSIVRCQAKSAAALLYRSGVASQLKPCTAPG
jgi:hypothetical protein